MSLNPPIPNTWHLRTVAEVSARSCIICFRPSTAVLITPDNKDFFYVCTGHLKDKGFCSPLENPDEKRKEALRMETEKIQQEYREKLAAKEKKEAEKKNGEGKNKEKDEKDERDSKDDGKEDKEKSKASRAASEKDPATPPVDELPRIYSLHRNFYQMRIDRIKKAELAKRNRERLSNPSTFPSVPSGLP